MSKIQYMNKEVSVEFGIEEYLGLINRRDSLALMTKMIRSRNENDAQMQVFCDYLKDIVDTFDELCEKVGTEFEQIVIDDDDTDKDES